ncbi:MAG: peptidoglycan DD-metalloendopeptidase family protein [Gammaproteobacteria bacterium]
MLLVSPGGDSQNAIAATSQDTPPTELSANAAPVEQAPAPTPTHSERIQPVRDVPARDATTDAGSTTIALALPPASSSSDATHVATSAPVPHAADTTATLPLPQPATPRVEQAPTPAPSAPLAREPRPAGIAPPTNVDGKQTRALAIPKRATNTALTVAPDTDDQPGEPLTLEIASGDSLDKLFINNDLSRGDLATLLAVSEAKEALTLLMPGDQISLRHDGPRILALTRRLDEERTLHIERTDEGFVPRIEDTPVEIRINRASATINSSLFLAAKAAGISDNLAMNLAGIFAWDIDFVLDIRKGDRFSVIYEEIWQNGRRLRDGNIVAAMFVNDGDEFRALRYTDPDDNDGYFTPDGVNVKKAFLRAPIKFTPRVTSNFNPKRLHPVHKRVRPHRGVDYGAPTGTPIIAAGDGKVLFRGRKGGYGNTVILQHGGNITTLYAHMSKFNRKVKQGSRVRQGQIIGYVGATGTVTARHLHYEYRVNGVHRNPRTVSLPKARPIPSKFKTDFQRATAAVQNQLEVVSRDTRIALGD